MCIRDRRWNVQRGVVVIPKSVHKNRMEQNMDIWDFTLSDADMEDVYKRQGLRKMTATKKNIFAAPVYRYHRHTACSGYPL